MIIGVDASRAVTRQRTGTEAYASFLIQALIPLAAQQSHQLRFNTLTAAFHVDAMDQKFMAILSKVIQQDRFDDLGRECLPTVGYDKIAVIAFAAA